MCGIIGILNLSTDAPIEEARLRQMLGMIRHRGPDQFGVYMDRRVGLGNARLCVVDLENGQQPITNEDRSLWVVFNGEIYNHIELRPQLEALGHRFETRSDTEVLLHLYEEYGAGCLSRLNGEFAFAVWDARQGTLFMARDRLGVRPLFYTVAGGALIFGSEIKALRADPRVRAELDPIALDQVFSLWGVVSPRTAFLGIFQLPPGHYLVAHDRTYVVQPYWELCFADASRRAETSERSEQDYVEELRALLVDAARIRLRADVPVGAYLSGGLDSSTLAAVARMFTDCRLQTFSISFSDPPFDESEFQLQVAQALGTKHQVVHATYADIGRVFPDVVWHSEMPIMRTAPAPMFLLSRLVRTDGCKVVLTGEGADEFLAGYDIFKEAKIRRFWARRSSSMWRPTLLRRLYPDISGLTETGAPMLRAFFGASLDDTDARGYSHAIRWRNNRRMRRLFSPATLEAIGTASPADAIRYPEAFDSWGALERAQYLESTIFLSQYLLSSQGDRMAMAHSVEGRFPFLDHRVVDFCNRLPSRLKLRGLTEKYVLKKAARPWLPPAITRRRKKPYRAPIHRSFFNEGASNYLDEVLSPNAIRSAGVFEASAVHRLVDKIRRRAAASETDDAALAGVVSTQLLYQQFVAGFSRSRPIGGKDDVKICIGDGTACNRNQWSELGYATP